MATSESVVSSESVVKTKTPKTPTPTNCPHCGYDGAGYTSSVKRHIAHCKKHLPPVEKPEPKIITYTCEHCTTFTCIRKDNLTRHQRSCKAKSVTQTSAPINEIVLMPDDEYRRKYDELQRKYDELQREHDELQRKYDELQEDHDIVKYNCDKYRRKCDERRRVFAELMGEYKEHRKYEEEYEEDM